MRSRILPELGLLNEIKMLYLFFLDISSALSSISGLKNLLIKSSAGPVINVVIKAINTNMANISSVRTPRS
ncbi:hypothetical protein D3C87_1336220 [compost metagenome]